MKLQNQVCSLEQGKRLAQLGISTNSHLSWLGDETLRLMDNGKDGVSYSNWVFVSQTEPVNNQEADWRDDVCISKPLAPAFTVAELGVMLDDTTPFVIESVDRTEAQSRAAFLIQLLEQGHLTPDECNSRLLNS